MRTTVKLDDQLLMNAKFRAAEQGTSLSCVIENALREALLKPSQNFAPITLITASGPGLKPGIDLDNSRSLLDIMDDPS